MGRATDSVNRSSYSHYKTTGCTGLDLVAMPFVSGEDSISTQQQIAVASMAVKRKLELIETGSDNVDRNIVDG